MVVNDYVLAQAYAGFGDDWTSYCATTYANDPALLAKCNSKPFGPLTLHPKTEVGRLQRGLPNTASGLLKTIGMNTGTDPVSGGPMGEDQGILGVPKIVFWAGAGTLALGIGLLAFKKKRRKK